MYAEVSLMNVHATVSLLTRFNIKLYIVPIISLIPSSVPRRLVPDVLNL